MTDALEVIARSLRAGGVVPYLGPGVLSLNDNALPASSLDLAARLTAKASVPHKIKNNLGAAAQFMETFKHRSAVTNAMAEAFAADAQPNALHILLLSQLALPLVVHTWYDGLPQKALRTRSNWGIAQGVSQAEHFGNWVRYYSADGVLTDVASAESSADFKTLLYQPLGSVWPARNFLVSDSDFVEVMTEIDIQSPIPECVQKVRAGKSFLFLGCRFATQMERTFAHQIIKRSSDKHWAILPEEPSRNEARFLSEHNIERVPVTLSEFVEIFAQMNVVH